MRLVALSDLQQFAAINLTSDPGHIPGPILIPNVWQVRILWGMADGKGAFNVLHVAVAPGSTPTAAIANGIKSAWQSLMTSSGLLPFLGNSSSMFNVDLRDLSPPGNNPLVSGTAGALTGTSASPSLPNEAAVVLTLRTAKAGPQNRGRIYLPNLATNAVDPTNVIIAGAVTALNSFAAGVISAVQTGGNTMVIAQPARAAYTGKTGTQHPARGAGSQQVTACILRDNHFDTVRRRGLK